MSLLIPVRIQILQQQTTFFCTTGGVIKQDVFSVTESATWCYPYVTWEAGAVVDGVSLLNAGASILAWRGAAWHVWCLTVLASVL